MTTTDSDTPAAKPAPGNDLLELLQQQGDIKPDQADQARARMRRGKTTPQQALLELGTVSQDAIYRAVAAIADLTFVALREQTITRQAIEKVPVKIALHYKFLPISLDKGVLTAAFSDPPSVRDRENLRLLLGLRIHPVIATASDVHRNTKQHYGLGAETVVQIHQGKTFRKTETAAQNQTRLDEDDQGASIPRLVNQLLLEALEMSATDIHVEPFEEHIQLRYRIDGVLRAIPTPPGIRRLHAAIISRMKVMADLDIAEKRLPHDGRVRVQLGSDEFDLRVSILPTRFGETLNLRILNRQTVFHDLQTLGLEGEHYRILTRLLNLPHGMILVTGPTGSGKSTTLYAALDKTDKTERKVITVEDPVEYQMEGISQIQVHHSIGLTFARGLRSILRHDPDVVLIGEIRDGETAEIAIRAAMTGHLVLSTLHTNDSVGAVNRLIDMGIEPFLVASTLRACLAQRLVRRICPHCRIPDEEVPERTLREITDFLQCELSEFTPFKGKGCVDCDYTGYRGRSAIFEFFLMDEDLEDMVAAHARSNELRQLARRHGMQSLRQDGWLKVQQGKTTVEEILRITSAFDISYS